MRKQSLTRQQLNKIFTNRTDKILQLSKQQRETGKDVREKENVEGGEQVMAKEKAESTVVKDGNTIKSKIKSKIGFIRTTQEADYLMDDEEYDNGNDSGKGVEVGDQANNVIYEDFGAVDVVENVVVDANNATENVTKTRAKKRKTAKEVRQAKPNPEKRSTARSHQNFRDRYLTVKKRVDVLILFTHGMGLYGGLKIFNYCYLCFLLCFLVLPLLVSIQHVFLKIPCIFFKWKFCFSDLFNFFVTCKHVPTFCFVHCCS